MRTDHIESKFVNLNFQPVYFHQNLIIRRLLEFCKQ